MPKAPKDLVEEFMFKKRGDILREVKELRRANKLLWNRVEILSAAKGKKKVAEALDTFEEETLKMHDQVKGRDRKIQQQQKEIEVLQKALLIVNNADWKVNDINYMRAVVNAGLQILESDVTGVEWKEACSEWKKRARKALEETRDGQVEEG